MGQKILFVASSFSHIVQFHQPYIRALRERGCTVCAAGSGRPDRLPEADRLLTLPFEKKMYAPANLRAASLLRRDIKKERYDLIIVHTSLAAFFTRLAVLGMKDRPRVINMVHGYLFDDDSSAPKRAALLAAERLMAGVTDLVLCMNQWDLALAERYRLGREVAYVPGVGVDESRFARPDPARGAALRAEYGIGADAFVLLYAAEFSPRKSQEVLIRAMERLPERAVLVLPGSGALLERCRALAESLGLAGRVIFPGQVQDMAAWYGAADAAVSASRSEGLPFNIMEAMCSGLPVIASDVKGNADLVTDGQTGLLVPYGDEAALAAAVGRVMVDGALRVRLGTQAREAVKPYCLETVFPQVMAQYERMLTR